MNYEAQRIVKNAAKCLICGDVIESKHRHDFVRCSCGNLTVDGGLEYIRWGVRDGWHKIESHAIYEYKSLEEIKADYERYVQLAEEYSSDYYLKLADEAMAFYSEFLADEVNNSKFYEND